MFTARVANRLYKYEFVHTLEETGYNSEQDKVKFSAVTLCNFYIRKDSKYELAAVGSVKLNTKKDSFSFEMGRKYAFASAIEQLNLLKWQRVKMWETYFEVFGKM